MKQHRSLPRRPLAAALGCLLAAAACSDQPSGPDMRTAAPALNTAAQPQLVSNAVRYRDTGQKPGVGRSGSASLSVLAVIDNAGITHIDVVSGTATQPGTGAGTLGNVQLKVFVTDTADNALVSNFHKVGSGRWSYDVMGPVRGTAVQVQAAVGGIDGSRTDVVTVRDTVVRAPDLRVAAFGPDRVRVGSPVNLGAYIGERNGDVGARADCVLYVDGVATDRAEGIWVDAWSEVYCVFTQTFTTPGPRQVEIRAENVSPHDWDASNNAQTRTVTVVDASSFSYDARASDQRSEGFDYVRRRWTEPSGATGEDLRDNSSSYASQWAVLYGWRPVGLALPVTARLEQSSGGNTYHSATLQGVGAGHAGGQFCERTWFSETGTFFYLCTSGVGDGGYTSFQYDRASTAVTYHSLTYSAQWDPAGTPTYVYSENFTHQSGTPAPVFGSEYSFLVELTDAGGQVYPTNPSVTLGLQEFQFSTPLQCNVVDDWYYDFYEYCWAGSSQYSSRAGFASLYP
jgi:hypothetical protein